MTHLFSHPERIPNYQYYRQRTDFVPVQTFNSILTALYEMIHLESLHSTTADPDEARLLRIDLTLCVVD